MVIGGASVRQVDLAHTAFDFATHHALVFWGFLFEPLRVRDRNSDAQHRPGTRHARPGRQPPSTMALSHADWGQSGKSFCPNSPSPPSSVHWQWTLSWRLIAWPQR